MEIKEEYVKCNGYYYSVSEAVMITILGSLCGLHNIRHLWAVNDKTREFLKKEFHIGRLTCYLLAALSAEDDQTRIDEQLL